MDAPIIKQGLTLSLGLGAAARTDYALATPMLWYPTNGQNLCIPTPRPVGPPVPQDGDASGLKLRWHPVAGAEYYVVQWCLNSSFSGPTVKAARETGTTHELILGAEVSRNRTYYWRVMAYNTHGGVSAKSDTWEFNYTCKDVKTAEPPSGGHGNKSLCEKYGCTVEIQGPEHQMCCDNTTWHLKKSWHCEDGAGNEICTVDNVHWDLDQTDGMENEIFFSDQHEINVNVQCGKSQNFVLRATVFFRTSSGIVFGCPAKKKVHVDCADKSKPANKPWNKIALPPGGGVMSYPNPEYYSGTSLPEYLDQEVLRLSKVLGVGKAGRRALAIGPVFTTKIESSYAPMPEHGCGIHRGYDTYFNQEARVHINVGDGLIIRTPTGGGSGPYSGNALNVGLGCGLMFTPDYYGVQVATYMMAGQGLYATSCKLHVDCGWIRSHCSGGGPTNDYYTTNNYYGGSFYTSYAKCDCYSYGGGGYYNVSNYSSYSAYNVMVYGNYIVNNYACDCPADYYVTEIINNVTQVTNYYGGGGGGGCYGTYGCYSCTYTTYLDYSTHNVYNGITTTYQSVVTGGYLTFDGLGVPYLNLIFTSVQMIA